MPKTQEDKQAVERGLWQERRELQERIKTLRLRRREMLIENSSTYSRLLDTRLKVVAESNSLRSRKDIKTALEETMQRKQLVQGRKGSRLSLMDMAALKSQKQKTREKKNTLIQESETYLKANQQRKGSIDNLNKELRIAKSEIEFVKRIQRDYYLKILKGGEDTRGRGLVWVMLQLQRAGESTAKDNLPDFLDEDGKEFLLELCAAESSIEAMRASKASLLS